MRPTKQLTASQTQTLEILSRYTDYTYVTGRPTLNVLVRLGLAEEGRIGRYRQLRGWRITHDGLIVLKQNGHYPVDPAMRSSVRDPRKAVSPAGKDEQ